MRTAADAYPLAWPEGRKRTSPYQREAARFDTSFARARDNIIREVHLLAGKWPDPLVVISSNIALRRDGLPLANQRQPDDPGVAVYFTYKKVQRCFACDRWKKVEHNMQAICKTIEALRGVARWGTGDMLDAAFTGFTPLPAPDAAFNWRDVLGPCDDLIDARAQYMKLRSLHHPDKGGGAVMFSRVQRAWEEASKEFER